MTVWKDSPGDLDQRKLLAQALDAVEHMQAKLAASERAKTEPIAVVGAGCRFPGGVDSPDRFWELLCAGRNAVTKMPAHRWSGAPDEAPFGGFVEAIDRFDADFFGISPREAESMDPQQRLVLEVAWEALEHAGIAPGRLRGSQTGVFIGATTTDYGKLAMSGDPESLDAYTATGNALNVIAGRVAYLLGLNGPAMAVDTACSSSIVAVHLACRSLRSGECDLALAGGVNALITEQAFICFQRWGMMSPRGQCRAFDAEADGFVRAEGCGVVALKRLSSAVADGDAIMAVIRASAVNQDGASSGLTVPNGLAQQAVIRRALESGGIDAGRIGYVEAHGTGTNIGDPIEIEAIGTVLCRNVERAAPLRVGSVKSNLGHMESAAGIGGLIKAVLCLERQSIPRSLHFDTPNPRIDWHRYAIEVPTEAVPWPRGDAARFAAVSGFGFSGTNGHIILEEAPATGPASDTAGYGPGLLCLSAKTPAALNDLAARYASWFETERPVNVADVCHAATRRAIFNSRLAVVGHSAEAFAGLLRAFRNGEEGTMVGGQARSDCGAVHFLFTGQGSQYSGMGAELYEREPVFRSALDRCTDLLRPSLEHPVRDVMFDGRHTALLNQTAYTQPALFALEWALTELWRSWGLTPSTVAGHSVGEYVAACVANIMTLEEGLKLLAKRAQLMQSLPAGGGMTSILAPESEVLALVEGKSSDLAVAAVNSADSAVISGPLPALEQVEREMTERGLKFTRLEVSHAFHSPLMEPMLAAFGAAARGIEYRQPSCRFLSNVTGRAAGEREIDADYWVRHVRRAVRFADCVSHLEATAADLFVEIGPAPVLLGLARQCLPASDALWVPSLRPGKGAREQMLESLGAAYVSGRRVNLGAAAPPRKEGGKPRLPTYAFQRSRHWLPKPSGTAHQPAPASRLLGSELDIATSRSLRIWQQEMSLKRFPFVDDHRVQGTPIVPATAYIEMMLQAAECQYGETGIRITNIDIRRAILLRADERQKVQLELELLDSGGARARISSRKVDDTASAWQLNVTADLEVIAATDEPPGLDGFQALKERCRQPVGGADFYRFQAAKGNQWGALFQGVQTLWVDGDEALTRVDVPVALHGELQKYRFHPAVSDACGHVLVGTIPLAGSDGPLGGAFVGGGVGEARFHVRPASTTLWCHARRRPSPDDASNVLCGDVTVFDDTGALVSETLDARLWYLDDADRAGMTGYEDWLYRIDWEKSVAADSDRTAVAANWTLIAGDGSVARALERRLLDLDQRVRVVDGAQSESALATALESSEEHPGREQRIVDLRFLEAQQGDFETAMAKSLAGLQVLVRHLATTRRPANTRLWIVTRSAVSVTGNERDISPAQALAWGFGRTVAVEHAEFWGGLVDLDPAGAADGSATRLVEHLSRKNREDQTALRGSDSYVPRLSPLRVRPESGAFRARPDASYLISGGLGGLGLAVAERLAERGAGHLLLLSRRRFPGRDEWASWSGDDERIGKQIRIINRIEERGCRVSVAAVDVSDAAALERQLSAWATDTPPIRGVVHAAGIMQYEAIVDHSVAAMQSVVASKALGAWELHRVLQDAPLDFFVMFSSASSLLSSPFMSSYSAANASLDTLAALRRAHNLPALAINWGTWREAGMLLDFDNDRGDVKLKGVGTLSNREGLGVLEYLLRTDVPQAGVMKIDWPEWQKSYAAFASSPYLQRFLAVDPTMDRGSPPTLTVEQLRSAAAGDRPRLIEAFLLRQVERIFKIPSGTVDVTRPLAESGLDSLMAVELRNAIDSSLGVGLPMVRLVEGPSIAALTAVITREFSTTAARQGIERVPRSGDLPLSHAQRRLWFLDQLDPGSGAYVIPSALAIHGEIDVDLVRRCLTEIVRRHESLRTVFESADGSPCVMIREPAEVAVALADISTLAAAEQQERVSRLVADNARQPFDLTAGPLMRASVVRLSASEHLLLLAFHHIVFDFWSAGIFVRELTKLYESFHNGLPSPLAEPPIQFLDFAHWQARRLAGGERERHLAYWRQQLDAALPFLSLPTDRPRSKAQAARGAHCSLRVGTELTGALAAFSQRQNVTLAMTLLAAFQILLHRLSGQDRVQTGMPVAGRDRPETTDLIGFFINTVVIRSDFSAQTSFREFLQQIRNTALGAYEHQDMPFEELVATLDPLRDMQRTPLFQVFFNHINMSVPAFELPGATVEPLLQLDLGSKFDLSFYAQEQDGGVNLMLVYDAAVFDGARMDTFLAQYRLLLEELHREPERPVGSYTLVDERARRQLPDPGSPLVPNAAYASGTLAARHIGRYGDRTALVGPKARWSYRQLDQRADQLASILLDGGIGRGDVIVLYAKRDPLLVCAMLAVVRAGAAFAILDHAYPDARLAENFRAAGARGLLLVGDGATPGAELESAATSADLRVRLHVTDALFGEAPVENDHASHPELAPDDVAYVAFTSGTTGGAKAIIGTHGPVAHFLDWQKDEFKLHEKDRFSLLSGLSHDPLLRDVFAPVWSGGSLHIPESDAIRDPVRLTKWMRTEEISVAHLTPATAALLTMEGSSTRLDALRYAFFGGDVLHADTVARLRELTRELHCVNFYGATETPQAMSFYSLLPGQVEMRERVPIGRGIDGVQLLVLNSADRLAGTGEVGEIVVRTPFLTQGYRSDETLTRKRFANNPFTNETGDRVYRTGDLGRYLPDGAVEIIGRADGQVQLRGFRIELGAIEATLGRCPAVKQCAVVLREDAPGDPRLVAYVVLSNAADGDVAGLRTFLEHQLPEHAIPSGFVPLDVLPLTPNGKLDRKALPAPMTEAPRTAAVEAYTPAEEIVANLFADALNVQHVGRNQSFFQLGGHSLLAARVAARLNSRFQVELPLRTLFESPTPAKLAVHLERLLQDGGDAGYLPIERRHREGPAPLSFAQERLWYLHQLEPHNTAYNLTGALEFRGTLDTHALAKALQAIVTRHESLRTCIGMVDGWPVQQIVEPSRFALEIIELPESTSAKELTTLLATQAGQPLDLKNGPLFRTVLYRLAPDRAVFLFICHHIVTDGWSLGVFVRELCDLYDRIAAGEQPELPPLPIQYIDYAAWQRDWLRDDRLETMLEYWRARLAGAAAHLELPTDRVRPPQFSYRGARYGFVLPAALRDELQALSRREGTTLFMTVLASFQLLLARYSDQHDILVGSPVANRVRPELEDMIGFFTNTLVLRSEISDSQSFLELLTAVRDTCLGAYAHQQLPFEQLVEALHPERDLSRNPLFQVMFALQNMALPALTLGEVEIASWPLPRNGAQMDLTLYMWETTEGLQAIFEYATDLFDETTIERMAGHLRHLLQSVVENPGAKVQALALLDDEERQRLLTRQTRAESDISEVPTAPSLIAAQAAHRPNAIAVRFDDVAMSYGELERRSNQVAHCIRGLALPDDALVGLYLHRSPDLIVAVLGVLKAGAAYLPLDPSFPAERLAYMIGDSGATLVLTEESLEKLLPERGVASLRIDAEEIRGAAVGSLPDVDPDSRAYVIYTSGSTGKPKGVEVTHRNVANFLASMAREPGLTPSDVLCAVTTLSFDISVLELLLPLSVGATVVLADRETASDGRRLGSLLTRRNVTAMQATPATWRLLIESGWQGDRQLKVLCGGEALPGDLAAALLERAGEVWNMYGPTETTIWSSCGRVTDPAAVHIGRPIANTAIYVVDARGELQPVGVPGEIWIGGDGVARGYLHRPELTAERFLPDPFTSGGRVYRTGDQGRWRADGTLQHLGRIDNQVKVRGFRIEPGEIETRLAELPQVEQAVVAVWQPSQGDQRLVAYYLGDTAVTAAELRAHLQQTLPDYMIPQFFVRLDALPLTPNGKIDRKALPAPLGDEAATAPYAPPRTGTEAELAAIWQELLGAEAIGRDDNFFERGGHSLLAARVVAHVNGRFQVELPLRTLFEAPTPARLAVHLDRLTQGGDQAAYRPIERRDPSRPAPLSFAQEQLWYLHQLAPDNTAYNLAGALELRGVLDERALQGTLETIVNRHESLRTSFVMTDGWPVQMIAGPSGFALETVELQPSIGGGELRDLLEQEIRRRFDLRSGPLFRTVLYKLGPEHSVILVTCHHIIMDGWSLGVFVRELGQVYARIAAGQEPDLPPLPIQYADYAAWQRDALAGERIESLLAYWRTTLAGSPPHLEVPTDRLRPPQFSHRGAHHAFTLPVALRDALQAVARREGATLFMTLLASFQLLLSRYSNQRDILVGSPVANRVRPELEGLIGDFVNTLVLRTELSNGMTFRELLGAVRSTCLGAYAHQQLPFEKLVEALRPGHDLSRNPVFQVMFALQNMALPSLTLGDLDIVPFRLERNGAQMDLTLYMWETPEGLQATFEYATDLFDAETIERMAGHFRNLLQAAANSPDTNILRLPLLHDNERQKLLTRGNRLPDQGNDTVLHLLLKQTASKPQRVAADYEGAPMTFAELDARSNRLAHHLQSLGVGPDALVGLCIPRGLDMLVGLLAILKAGGAWLPLDPDFPTERLRFMLEDSGATVLVSLDTVAEEAINDLPLSRVNLDTDRALIEACSSEPPAAAVHGDHLAYVIYTSGSTGRPKGVEIEHRALANFLRSMARQPGMSESDVLVAVTTLSFDISILELLLPLVTGARVVIASRDTALDGQRLAAELRRAEATLLQATPATWRLLVESGWEGDGRLKALCGGEALPADLAAALLERVGELWNMYGPTETTIWSTCTRIANAESVHIGTPVANTEVFILNEALEPQPVGVPGHLYIGGHGVARGYHNRPDLVAERFLAHPFGGQGRIYATGDRARWRTDGTIEHLGRLDNQVKVRGYRIELGEIESCLAEHPDVKQCAVALRESGPGDQRLVACYVARGGRQTTVTSLRSHLKALLPSYMIPQHFIEMDALPLTPNGKVDRNALPVPGGGPSAEDRYMAPVSEAEKRLAALWQEMLGTDRIGVNDNFFDLGGHSLLAARLVNRLQEQFGVRVTLQALTADTLGQIASSIAITPADEVRSSAEGGPRRPGSSPAGFIRRLLRRQGSGQQ